MIILNQLSKLIEFTPVYRNQTSKNHISKWNSFSFHQVDNNKKLGEWAGLCKIDKDGKARKIVGCSCVVIKVSHT